jgi:hypothetical protein
MIVNKFFTVEGKINALAGYSQKSGARPGPVF